MRFFSHFPKFLTKASPILLNVVNFLWKVLLIFVCKDKNNYCRLSLLIFMLKVLAEFFKIKTFASKTGQNIFR